MENKIKWELVIDTLIDEKCVILLGPEMLEYRGGELYGEALNRYLQTEIGENLAFHSTDEFLMFTDEKAKVEAFYKIKKFHTQTFDDVAFASHETLKKLVQIPAHLYLSVNPDLFLMQTFEKYGFASDFQYYQKKKKPAAAPTPTLKKPLIYNLLGTVEQKDSLVLTHDDMFTYQHSILGINDLPPELQNVLKTADNFLFVGFRFDKWYVQLIIRLLAMYFKKERYQYSFNKNLKNHIKSFYFDEFGIEFIDNNINEFISELYERCASEGILREIRSTTAGSTLSPKEQIIQLIKKAEIDEALKAAQSYLEKNVPDLANDLILIANKHSRLQKKIERGIISEENKELEAAQVSNALLELLNE